MLPYELISFSQLLEGPGKGYSPAALAALTKAAAPSGAPTQEPAKPKAASTPAGGKWTSAGAVVIPSLTAEGMGKCYIRLPAGGGQWGGWTLAKGRVDEGERMEQTAKREVFEELGVVAALLPGSYLGKYEGGHSVTHYFVAVQTRKGLSKPDKETQEVRLVSFDEAIGLFTGSSKARDTAVVNKAREFLDAFKKSKGITLASEAP